MDHKKQHHILFNFINTITASNSSIDISLEELKNVESLLNNETNINYMSNGLNLLSLICRSKMYSPNTIKIAELLIEKKINVNDPLLNPLPIESAIKKNRLSLVQLLLENKAQINEFVFNNHIKHFSILRRPLTKLLLEYMPKNRILKIMFNYNNFLMYTCNLGCLIAFKELVHNNIDVDKIYNGVEVFLMHSFNAQFGFYPYSEPMNLTLLQIVMLNVNNYDNQLEMFEWKKNILGHNKDLNNYIEIAKILINLGANLEDIELNKIIKLHIIDNKNKIIDWLLLFFPRVLTIMITNYIYNPTNLFI
jgi:hypothetical protein